jgi:chromosomal replication initiator protein
MILVSHIQQAVADAHSISVESMRGKCRMREFVYPRQEAMFLCRRLIRHGRLARRLPISLPAIGRRFGNRDHTTVLSALRAVDKRREADPLLRIKMRRMVIAARSMGL